MITRLTPPPEGHCRPPHAWAPARQRQPPPCSRHPRAPQPAPEPGGPRQRRLSQISGCPGRDAGRGLSRPPAGRGRSPALPRLPLPGESGCPTPPPTAPSASPSSRRAAAASARSLPGPRWVAAGQRRAAAGRRRGPGLATSPAPPAFRHTPRAATEGRGGRGRHLGCGQRQRFSRGRSGGRSGWRPWRQRLGPGPLAGAGGAPRGGPGPPAASPGGGAVPPPAAPHLRSGRSPSGGAPLCGARSLFARGRVGVPSPCGTGRLRKPPYCFTSDSLSSTSVCFTHAPEGPACVARGAWMYTYVQSAPASKQPIPRVRSLHRTKKMLLKIS